MKKFYKISVSLCVAFFSILQAEAQTWSNIGMTTWPEKTIGQIYGMGRCSQLKFHTTDANKMYTASASGGLWYSANKAVSWTGLGTDQITNVQSASICVDPTNDQTIYWGTGDANYYSSGVGVYKTTNGGTTWTLSNTGMGNRLVIEMLVLPTDNKTIIAATNNGIYKSTDAGANWTLKTASGINFQDMVFKPGSSGQTIYATAAKAYYRSTDAGSTWTQITSVFTMGGGGTRVAVCPASTNVVYVANNGAGDVTEIYKSTDGVSNFTSMRAEPTKLLAGYSPTSTGQGNYNFDIDVNPANAAEIYLCAHIIWRSTDSGANWSQQQSTWAYYLHTDQHHFVFDPYVSGQLWNANDGGIWTNSANGTGDWSPMMNGIAASEIYHGWNSNISKDIIDIGLQDNAEFYSSGGKWYNNRGGDWGPRAYFDYKTNYVYYGNADGNGQRRLLPGGGVVNFGMTPQASSSPVFAFTPASKDLGFASDGASALYRSTNISVTTPTWSNIYTAGATIKAIGCSPTNANILYLIDASGNVYKSTNATTGSSTFTKYTSIAAGVSEAFIATTEKDQVFYVSINKTLYRSSNQGSSFTNISSGFPSSNVLGLIYDRYNPREGLYAAYNLGVYYKDTTLSSWTSYATGLPIVSGITDLFAYNDGLILGSLRVSYYGRGVWESPMKKIITNISPVVSLTAPTNNALYPAVPATVNLTATASDADGSVSKVEFYQGNTLLGSDNTSPYAYSWTNVVAGTYLLTAVAYDNLGAKDTSSVVTIVVGNQSPVVNITSPANNANFSQPANITITATASDPDGTVSKVEFYNGATLLGSDASSPYSFAWTNVIAGTYQLTAKAYDNLTGVKTSSVITVTVGNQNPVVFITTPANNSAYTSPATIALAALASDADGSISKVEFYNGGTLLGTVSSGNPFTYSWNVSAVGSYTITAKAYDNMNGTSASAAINITVNTSCSATAWSSATIYVQGDKASYNGHIYTANWWSQNNQPDLNTGSGQWTDNGPCASGNQSPNVNISAPANNAVYGAPGNISITANATDADGTVASVKFYQGTTLLNTDNASPFSYNWSGVAAGTYQLIAVATDNSGTSTTSSSIMVMVKKVDCTGVTGGTAFVDSCGTCAGGNTGLTPVLNINNCVTQLKEINKEQVNIFPNPNGGVFNVQLQNISGNNTLLKIYSLEGKIVYEKTFQLNGSTHLENIDISSASEGIYVVSIHAENYNSTVKINIQNAIKPKKNNF